MIKIVKFSFKHYKLYLFLKIKIPDEEKTLYVYSYMYNNRILKYSALLYASVNKFGIYVLILFKFLKFKINDKPACKNLKTIYIY